MTVPPPDNAAHRTGRPTAAEAGQREQSILDTALEMVKEVGYDRFSIDALAERAHVGKATIYRHWPGKAALIAEAVRRRHETHAGPLADTGSLRGDLRAAVRRIIDAVAAKDGPLLLGVMAAMHADPDLADLLRVQVFESKHAEYDEIVARAVARGELPGPGGAALLHEILPALVAARFLVLDLPADDEFADHLVDDVALPLLQFRPPQETTR
jgi:AcrR family transcriptional regulator